MSETEAPLAPTADEAARPGGPPAHDDTVVDILAAKILIDWLRNRQQLLVPFSIDLQKVDERQSRLLVEAMLAAAQADGSVDGKERERVDAALALLNAADTQREMIDAILDRPRALARILGDVPDVQSGAMFYAASLLAIDRRKPVNRHYLRYLAGRLQLPEEIVKSLEQRYRTVIQ